MPVDVRDIAKKAEVSLMLGIITHRPADSFYSRIKGGLQNIVRSFVIGNLFFPAVYMSRLGILVPTVIYHAIGNLLHLIYADVNAMFVAVQFT